MAAEPACTIRLPRWILRVRIFQIVNDIAILGFLIYSINNLSSTDVVLFPDTDFEKLASGEGKVQSYMDLQLFNAISTLPLLVCVICSSCYPPLSKLWFHLAHETYSTFWWSIGFLVFCGNVKNLNIFGNFDSNIAFHIIIVLIIALTTIQWLTFLTTLTRVCISFHKFRKANPHLKSRSLFAISIRFHQKSDRDPDSTFSAKPVSSNKDTAESLEQNEQDDLNAWRAELPSSYDVERSQRPINSRRAELPATQRSQVYELHGGLGGNNL